MRPLFAGLVGACFGGAAVSTALMGPGGIRPSRQRRQSAEDRSELKHGVPTSPTQLIVDREGYSLSYDCRTRNALWTAERLTKDSLGGPATRKKAHFREDTSIPEIFRARLADFKHSGFDRGHLVPAGDMKRSDGAMQSTFLLSNISPQIGPGFNRGYWERLERWCRELTRHYHAVTVYTGPLFLPTLGPDKKWRVSYEMIGAQPNVAVPTHYFKASRSVLSAVLTSLTPIAPGRLWSVRRIAVGCQSPPTFCQTV